MALYGGVNACAHRNEFHGGFQGRKHAGPGRASVYHPEIGGCLTGPDKSALPTYSRTLVPRLLPCSRRTRASAKCTLTQVPSTATRCVIQVPSQSLQAHDPGRKPWEDSTGLCGPEPPPSAAGM